MGKHDDMTVAPPPETVRILLLIRDRKTDDLCHDYLTEQGVELFRAQDLRELVAIMDGKTAFHGVVADIRFSMKADAELKQLLRRLENIYPFLRVKPDAAGTLYGISSLTGPVSLADFLGQCRTFPARPLREEERRNEHVSAWLSTMPGFADAEASVSINLSCHGAFFYSARVWAVGAPVWVRFPGHDQDFSARVCWCRPWGGKSDGLPGIGVEFQEVSEQQCALLKAFLGSA
jgi:hypothetical protein